MRLAPGDGELSRHADITDPDAGTRPGRLLRIHIPLVTNSEVIFESWDARGTHYARHMTAGEAWYLDTRKPHRAKNGGPVERIHLVMDVESSPALLELLGDNGEGDREPDLLPVLPVRFQSEPDIEVTTLSTGSEEDDEDEDDEDDDESEEPAAPAPEVADVAPSALPPPSIPLAAEPVRPRWMAGDSLEVTASLPEEERFDFIFSCPPYGDLEVYSEDPADLSVIASKDRGAFLDKYREIIRRAVARLRPDRFAAIVVGDYRDRQGFYSNFVSETIRAFEDAGARLYNEAVFVTAAGSLPVRIARQFSAGRKMGRTHQNLLVFCKGDPKRATEACGPVTVEALSEEDGGPVLDLDGEPAPTLAAGAQAPASSSGDEAMEV